MKTKIKRWQRCSVPITLYRKSVCSPYNIKWTTNNNFVDLKVVCDKKKIHYENAKPILSYQKLQNVIIYNLSRWSWDIYFVYTIAVIWDSRQINAYFCVIKRRLFSRKHRGKTLQINHFKIHLTLYRTEFNVTCPLIMFSVLFSSHKAGINYVQPVKCWAYEILYLGL